VTIPTLYHFTTRERLASIMREGLYLTDVPKWSLFEDGEPFAVWLTADPRPTEQGLGFVREFTDYDRFSGLSMEQVISLRELPPDKTETRITIRELEPRKLARWSDWARGTVEPQIYDELVRRGGVKHLSWFLYFEPIPPAHFKAVELRGVGNRYAPGKVIHAAHRFARPQRAA
jgi:hypothetical protein